MDKKLSKIMFLYMAIFLLLVCFLGGIIKLRSEGLYSEKRGKMEFLRYTLYMGLVSNHIEKVSPLYPSRLGGFISWREYLINQLQTEDEDTRLFYPIFQYSFSFQSPFSSGTNRTNILAVVGKRTVWNGTFDENIFGITDTKDKILFLEFPGNEIVLNSMQDYSVEEALNLWENNHSNFYLKILNATPMYITTRGRIGNIADFKTKEAFKEMLEYSESELNQISVSAHLQ